MKTMHRVNALFLCFWALLYVLSTSHQLVAQSFLVTQLGPNTHPSNGSFGVSSSISGTTVVIGAKDDDDRGTDAGAAYVFVRSGSGWIQQAKLTASDGAANDQFGSSVGISADTVVVGAHLDDDEASGSGSAYVFVRNGSSWSQQAKLVAGDPGPGDSFGFPVAISGDTIVVGSPSDDELYSSSGAAYVFVRNGSIWSQQAKLKSVGSNPFAKAFGETVAISGDTIVVGFDSDQDGGVVAGSAYVFVRSGTSWTQQARLTANDAVLGDDLGEGVAISGDTVVVGARGDDEGADGAGSVYVFVRVGTSWIQEAKLMASDPAIDRRFGASVAIDGNTLAVEAVRLGGGTYVFERTGGIWVEQIKLPHGSTPGNPTPNRLSISGHRIVSSNFVFEPANQPPVADAGPDQTVECASSSGANVTLNGSASSDPDGDTLTSTWTVPFGTQTGAEVAVTLVPGTHTITLTVDDGRGGTASDTVTVAVSTDPTPPSITCPANIAAVGNIPNSCSAALNPGVATAIDACSITSVVGVRSDGLALSDPYPLGNTMIAWTATDTAGNSSSCQQGVTVTNPNPLVTITGPSSGAVYAVGAPVSFTGTFTDNLGGMHTATWMFDSITQGASVVEPTSATPGLANTTFTFTNAGVYLVSLTVGDGCGGTGIANTVDGLTAMVVVYDPDGGFVTGGGWIDSPAGAYPAEPSLTGKANFGFVSNYQHGATIPTGQTEFQFKVANLTFHSTVYEWLVVAGARAQYKGTGTINGSGNYRFLLTAIDRQVGGDSEVDKFRIKIWDKNNGDAIIYDNKLGSADTSNDATELGGGSIIIHKQ